MAWQRCEAEAHRSKFWSDRRSRSCLALPYVSKLFTLLALEDFSRVSPQTLAWLSAGFSSNIAQTKVVEDMFGVLRDLETRNQKSKSIGPAKQWLSLVQAKVLEEVHNYQAEQVQTGDIAQRGALPQSLFQPDRLAKEQLSLPSMTDIMGKRTWTSFDATSSLAQASELALLLEAHRHDQWGTLASTAFLCQLLQPGLCVQKSKRWYISMGPVEGLAALLWPLSCPPSTATSGQGLLRLQTEAVQIEDMAWAVVASLEDWVTLPCEWSSPVRVFIDKVRGGDGPEVCLRAVGPQVPLLQMAAQQAFWKLPLTFLRQLAKHLGVQLPDQTLPGVLLALMKKCWPGADELALLSALAKRLPKANPHMDMLQQVAQEDLLSDDEGKAVEDIVEEAKKQEEQQAALRGVLVERRAALKSSSAQAKAKSAGSKPAVRAAKKARLVTPHMPSGQDPALEEMLPLMPPGGRLYKDHLNNRWRGYYDGFSVSRSWVWRPSKESVVEVVGLLWAQHTMATGEACPYPDLAATL